jgi:hypothetical protein
LGAVFKGEVNGIHLSVSAHVIFYLFVDEGMDYLEKYQEERGTCMHCLTKLRSNSGL